MFLSTLASKPTVMIRLIFSTIAGTFFLCATFIALLTVPFFQNQGIYLNSIRLTWFQDVAVPEQWGFMHNQVTPFTLQTPDGEILHAWHILPLGLYLLYETELLDEPSGIVPDVTKSLGFKILREDPEALLVLYFHGAAGTLGSGWRPPSYRAMSATSPNKIHTIAIDYRGFGASTGRPTEEGLLLDALTLAEFALKDANIPPSRIAIFGQSLGTAVGISLAHHMATRPTNPILFSGMVLVAPFADVELLIASYRVAGMIPLLDPLARFPRLMALLNSYILSRWPSKDKLAEYLRHIEAGKRGDEAKYHIEIIHAEDDYDIPWSHSDKVFWHAVNATSHVGTSFEDLETYKLDARRDMGAGGWVVECFTQRGLVREEIVKYGLHDRIMSYPVVSRAVSRALRVEVLSGTVIAHDPDCH
ncbi:Alpha/Beta hydrolase protein [Podospora didyma]|uniref:Alpha/Beta hydrolase protein n=1 Tax=Podospora didyma TaxID=330526 RepID=A0AAE0K2T8_9PEZI|nr:Alpha/Beta hydrolase protein [Podospora didyma]